MIDSSTIRMRESVVPVRLRGIETGALVEKIKQLFIMFFAGLI